jgi:hypothetical protein
VLVIDVWPGSADDDEVVVPGVVTGGVVAGGVVAGGVVAGGVVAGGVVGTVIVGTVAASVTGGTVIASAVVGVVVTGGSLLSSLVSNSASSTPTMIASRPATMTGPVGPRPLRSEVPQYGQNGASSAIWLAQTGHARVSGRPSGSVNGCCGGVAMGATYRRAPRTRTTRRSSCGSPPTGVNVIVTGTRSVRWRARRRRPVLRGRKRRRTAPAARTVIPRAP